MNYFNIGIILITTHYKWAEVLPPSVNAILKPTLSAEDVEGCPTTSKKAPAPLVDTPPPDSESTDGRWRLSKERELELAGQDTSRPSPESTRIKSREEIDYVSLNSTSY
jgi:hypothetical protein